MRRSGAGRNAAFMRQTGLQKKFVLRPTEEMARNWTFRPDLLQRAGESFARSGQRKGAELRARSAFRSRDPAFHLIAVYGAVQAAVRAARAVISQNKILLVPQNKYRLALDG